MKRTLLSLLTLGVFVSSLVASNVMAQSRPVNQPATTTAGNSVNNGGGVSAQQTIPVGIVDIEYLMLVHPELDVKNKQLLAESQAKEKNFRAKQEMLQLQAQELNGLVAGSDSYRKKSDDLMKARSDLEREAARTAEDLRIKSVQNQHKAFKEIQGCIDLFARNYNFLVVLNYVRPVTVLPPQQTPQFVATTPNEKAMEIQLARQDNSAVLWYNPGYDITPKIEEMINKQYPQLEKVNFTERKLELFQRQRNGNNETTLAQPTAPVHN
ncbi:MAG: OmpH family outer membrane protein [Planctomycetaceae bacterium]|jgi:Skp family chaperone for outer membrane proteins|nr:OmpH family outer membrane protein [Planctomycetaceae bacterium]